MRRAFVFVVLTIVLTAIAGACAVMFGLSVVPVVPGILLVAYTAIVDGPVAAAINAALVGFAMDALFGTPLGVNVLSCVAVLIGSRFFLGWVPQPRGIPSFLFVAGVSAASAFVSLLLLFLFQRRESFGMVGVFTVALSNAIASLLFFPIFQKILARLSLDERGASLQERLATK